MQSLRHFRKKVRAEDAKLSQIEAKVREKRVVLSGQSNALRMPKLLCEFAGLPRSVCVWLKQHVRAALNEAAAAQATLSSVGAEAFALPYFEAEGEDDGGGVMENSLELHFDEGRSLCVVLNGNYDGTMQGSSCSVDMAAELFPCRSTAMRCFSDVLTEYQQTTNDTQTNVPSPTLSHSHLALLDSLRPLTDKQVETLLGDGRLHMRAIIAYRALLKLEQLTHDNEAPAEDYHF
jgi:hypothetical protein